VRLAVRVQAHDGAQVKPVRCPHGTCQWVKARTRETCTVCGNVFPCPRSGKHAYLDCGSDIILTDAEAANLLGM